jgi:dynein heavy chain, axonemal
MEIFKGEIEETTVKVSKAMKSLLALKDIYNRYRENLKDYFKEGEPREWEFAPVLVFHRFDKFVERVRLVNVRCFL